MYISYLHCLCLTQFKDVYTIYTGPLSVQTLFVTAPSCNVWADPTEIAVSFHRCDRSGIFA
jgi:hypothetical protein